MGNIVAIVGRPNVGKSTFFNRLAGARQAIVESKSGVTRDRHYGRSDWNGVEFSIIDTGGYVSGSEDVFEKEIRRQVELAVDEADVIIFMVDVTAGLTGMDEEVAEMLRKTKKKVFVVANKVDNAYRMDDATEFYAMGLDTVFPVSSINGSGTGDLLDEVVKELNKQEAPDLPDLPRIAVVGRPNVGKSSLINALLNDDRNIVTPIAGTTRDSIHIKYEAFGNKFLLVDTAGLRKKAKVHENIEFYSVMRAIRAIEGCDVCLLMLDATQGIESQDLNVFRLADKNKKGIVILVNKWDLVEKDANTHLKFAEEIKHRIAPMTDVPIIFTSVLTKQRIFKTIETATSVYESRQRKIPTSKLNSILLPIIQENPPPVGSRGRYVRIKYITQLNTHYPSFAFFCNFPQDVKDSYKRFLENKIRENFVFTGVPIQVYFRKK